MKGTDSWSTIRAVASALLSVARARAVHPQPTPAYQQSVPAEPET
jgi:hypothetical protein